MWPPQNLQRPRRGESLCAWWVQHPGWRAVRSTRHYPSCWVSPGPMVHTVLALAAGPTPWLFVKRRGHLRSNYKFTKVLQVFAADDESRSGLQDR